MALTSSSGIITSSFKMKVISPRPSQPFVRIIETTRQQNFSSEHLIFNIVFSGFLVLLMYQLTTILHESD